MPTALDPRRSSFWFKLLSSRVFIDLMPHVLCIFFLTSTSLFFAIFPGDGTFLRYELMKWFPILGAAWLMLRSRSLLSKLTDTARRQEIYMTGISAKQYLKTSLRNPVMLSLSFSCVVLFILFSSLPSLTLSDGPTSFIYHSGPPWILMFLGIGANFLIAAGLFQAISATCKSNVTGALSIFWLYCNTTVSFTVLLGSMAANRSIFAKALRSYPDEYAMNLDTLELIPLYLGSLGFLGLSFLWMWYRWRVLQRIYFEFE